MFRKYLQPKILLKNTLAAFLMITVSGVYCLFCCTDASAAASEAEHCPLSKTVTSEHCDFSKKNAAETSTAEAKANAFECCGLKFNFYVAKLDKNEFSQKTPSALARNFSSFPQSASRENKTGLTAFFYRAPVYEKGSLHVKNRVFRI